MNCTWSAQCERDAIRAVYSSSGRVVRTFHVCAVHLNAARHQGYQVRGEGDERGPGAGGGET